MTLDDCPSLDRVVQTQLEVWPEHRDFLAASLAQRDERVLRTSETVAGLVLRLADGLLQGLPRLCRDYRYMCEDLVLAEELYFRRHGRYRLSSFEEANRLYYSDKAFMDRYMNGLLISNLLWSNHAHALDALVNDFLPALPQRASLLEVGPGHGLLLALAVREPRVGSSAGWDISQASIDATRHAIAAMGVSAMPRLEFQNLFDAAEAGEVFDCIILNEVLEHLEDPVAALACLHPCLRPGGRIWINVPTNSPAPDHLYLLTEPEETGALLQAAGFEVVESRYFPMTGYSLERARRQRLTISSVAIGTRAA